MGRSQAIPVTVVTRTNLKTFFIGISCPYSSSTAEMAPVGGNYAIQSRSLKVTNFDTNRKPVCDFLLLNNTNSNPTSHRFQVTADNWSNVRFWQGVSLFNTLIRYETLNSRLRYSANKKLEPLLYRRVEKYFDILNRLGVNHQCDGQTDGQTEWT